MNLNDFNKIIEERIEILRNTLLSKGEEYTRGDDRLHNFKTASRVSGNIPEVVLMGFLLKHWVSVNDMINDIAHGKIPTRTLVNEKIGDVIAYMFILEALIEDTRQIAEAVCPRCKVSAEKPTEKGTIKCSNCGNERF